MEIVLTKAEREILEVGAALIGWADTDTAKAELEAAVCRIIAGRVAQ